MGQLWDRLHTAAKAHSGDLFGDNAAWNADQLRYGHLYQQADDDALAREIENAARAGKQAEEPLPANPPPASNPTPAPAPLPAHVVEALRELGLPQNALPEQIRTAYKTLITQHHPDLTAGLSAELQFTAADRTSRINQAYQVVKKAFDL